MATRPKLEASKREILGRRVKKLRREGILPANLYGKKVKSQALKLSLKDFQKVFEKVGETGLIDLKLGSKKTPVLIDNVQFDPVTGIPIHADFHQVSLTEKTTATIPIELVGESEAVEKNIGILIRPLSEVEVEALPTNLPESLTVDISNLKEIDDAVTVADLNVDEKKVKVLANKSEIVAKIEPPTKEEEAVPPSTEVGEEAVPAEEEEAPAEGSPGEGKPSEGKPEEGQKPEGKRAEKKESTEKPKEELSPEKPTKEKK